MEEETNHEHVRKNTGGADLLIRLAPLVAGCLLLLAFAESRAQLTGAGDASTVRGKVERFTTAPMGETDGAMLDDGTWLHWPPHMQDRFANILSKGDQVRATGRTETGPAGDTHFEVQSVTNLRTNAIAENPDYANGPPPRPLDGEGGPHRHHLRPARIVCQQELTTGMSARCWEE